MSKYYEQYPILVDAVQKAIVMDNNEEMREYINKVTEEYFLTLWENLYKNAQIENPNISDEDKENINQECDMLYQTVKREMFTYIIKERTLKDFNNELKILNSNHMVIDFKTRDKITYICGQCKNTNQSAWLTIKYRARDGKQDTCKKCSRRKPIEDLQELVKQRGMILLTTADTYKNNKNIEVICKCGSPWTTEVKHIKNGRKCRNCTKN